VGKTEELTKAKELLPEKEAKINTMEQEIKTLRNQLKETNQLKEVQASCG